MKIAYVTHYDVNDIHKYSGIGYYIARSFEQQGLEVTVVGPLKDRFFFSTWLKRGWYKSQGKRHLTRREPVILRNYARQVQASLSNLDIDVVFSPGTLPLSYLETHKSLVCWCDATFDGMVNFYDKYSNLSVATLKNGHEAEMAALSRCKLAIYSSTWAAQSALKNYRISSEKVKVVPYGANIEESFTSQKIRSWIDKRLQSKCSLLFIGVDWHRKGGDIVLQIAKTLHEQGQQIELNLVGSYPPDVNLPEYVKSWGFISKSTSKGRELLSQLFSKAHFLLLPTRADCVPVVIAEANAHGVPVITTDVGGISFVVTNKRNGMLFSSADPIENYVAYILDMMKAPVDYQKLAERSFREHQTRLNWDVAAASVKNLLLEYCQ